MMTITLSVTESCSKILTSKIEQEQQDLNTDLKRFLNSLTSNVLKLVLLTINLVRFLLQFCSNESLVFLFCCLSHHSFLEYFLSLLTMVMTVMVNKMMIRIKKVHHDYVCFLDRLFKWSNEFVFGSTRDHAKALSTTFLKAVSRLTVFWTLCSY